MVAADILGILSLGQLIPGDTPQREPAGDFPPGPTCSPEEGWKELTGLQFDIDDLELQIQIATLSGNTQLANILKMRLNLLKSQHEDLSTTMERAYPSVPQSNEIVASTGSGDAAPVADLPAEAGSPTTEADAKPRPRVVPGTLYVSIQFQGTERLYKIVPGKDLRIGSSPEMELVGDPNMLPPHVATIRIQDGKLVIVNEAKQNRITIEHARHQDVVVMDTPVELTGHDEIHIEGLFLNMTLGTLYRTDLVSPVFRQHVSDVINHPSLYRSEGGFMYAVKTDSLQYAHVIKNSEPATAITDLPHFDDNELANASDSRFQWYRPEGGMLTYEADARLYIPLEPTVSSQDRNQLIAELWELVRQNPKRVYFKVRKTLRSRDAIVVFFNHAVEKAVADRVIAITQSFDPKIYARGPAFTQRLAPGVYFGQNPNAVQEFDVFGQQKDVSFSTLRGEAMAQAWEIIVKAETPGHPLDVDEKMAIIAHVFQKRDIDTDNPAFNASGPTTFPHIQKLIRQGGAKKVDWEALAQSEDFATFYREAYEFIDRFRAEMLARLDAQEDPRVTAEYLFEVYLMRKQIQDALANFMRTQGEASSPIKRIRRHDVGNLLGGMPNTRRWISDIKLGYLHEYETDARNFCNSPIADLYNLSHYIISHYGDVYVDVRFDFPVDTEVRINKDSAYGLQSILDNIILNAIRHGGKPLDSLQIMIQIDPRRISIKDNGVGIDEPTLAAIRSGQRISEGKPLDDNDNSTIHGSGWQSIRHNSEELGIKWTVDSVLGKGTTVTLALPDGFMKSVD